MYIWTVCGPPYRIIGIIVYNITSYVVLIITREVKLKESGQPLMEADSCGTAI